MGSLPTIGIPTYETSLPSNGSTVKFRPFLVKEEKILLIALETGDKRGQHKALKQILKNCIMSDINVDKLSVFDVEYLFIQIRGKSVGETLEPVVVCPNPNCKASGKMKIPLADAQVNKANLVETPHKVMLSDKVGISLVYPDMSMIEDIDPDKAIAGKDTETIFKIIIRCIDQIFDGEEVFNPKDYSEKELISFIEGVPTENFKKIVDFVSSMPRVEKEVHFRCPSCGTERDMVLRGIEDFFGSVSPTTV
jgi:hypothetical protein